MSPQPDAPAAEAVDGMSAGAVGLLAAALTAGCLLPGPWPAAAAGALVLVVAARVARSPTPAAARGRLLLAAGALLLIGSGLAGAQQGLADRGPLAALAERGGRATMTATVVTDARVSPAGAWQLVRVEAIAGRPTRARGLLRLPAGAGAPAAPDLGARVAFEASARPLARSGFEAHLRRLHAGVALRPSGPPRVVAPPAGWLRATTTVRARVRAAAGRWLPHDAAVLLSGLVTGDTTGERPERRAQFEATGLTHLVAVSGSNVALVVAGVLGVTAAAGLGLRGRSAWAAGAVVWFAILVRLEPSVLRASAMALLVLAGRVSGRRADPRHALGVTVLVLLLLDPLLAGQLGFLLSVAATAGVLVLAPLLRPRLRGWAGLRTLLAASVGAQVAVAPVLLATGDGLPVAALPANLLAVPAAGAASGIGIAASLLAQVAPPLAALVAASAAPFLAVVLGVAALFAGAPTLTAADLLGPVALALAGAVAALLLRRRRLAMIALAVAGVLLVLPPRPAADVPALVVTALDVGQGDAILIEVPAAAGSARMLVDAGPDPEAVAEALLRRGVRRLDVLALSHGHADHVAGAAAVLRRLSVGTLLVAGAGAHGDAAGGGSGDGEARLLAQQRGVPVTAVVAGQRFALGQASVEVLSPPAGFAAEGRNDTSLVLRVAHPSGSVLLTGDAERAAQQVLLRSPGRLRSDVLKVPHHGAASNAEGFLEAVAARVALISVGAGNDYGHPHPATLADLAGTRVRRTDLEGDVRLLLSVP